MATELWIFLIVIAAIVVAVMAIIGRFVALWFQAFVSGTPISLFNIIGMSLRKIPPKIIVNARINAYKAGLKQIEVNDLETHYLARGHVLEVVAAMIAADKANISLDWRQATAIDLAGRDILDAVKTSVYPKVIDCPDASQGGFISAVAKNGVQLKCRARVTVRTNLAQLVGGATEETVIARVGEGIVSAIGSADTHFVVLESPDKISRLVLDRGLDAQTAFEILSIDIADIDVGKNIGAILETDRAEANKKIAQAAAEGRRAMAVAEVTEMEAYLVKQQALVPQAIAEAFRAGHLGIMDYYRMKNVQADTHMRESISKEGEGEET
jgi:uncharacterized protein YqfA (UPF0365 family)